VLKGTIMGSKQRIDGKIVNAVAFRDSGIGKAEIAPNSGAGDDAADLTSVASEAQTAAESWRACGIPCRRSLA